MRHLKVVLSILLVLGVSFLVVKGCVHKKPEPPSVTLGAKPSVKKKIVLAVDLEKKPAATPLAEVAGGASIAIILDDWGNNYSLMKQVLQINRPMTLSILPHLSQSRRIAEEAFNHKLGVMLHMPMQPKNNKERLEPNTILTTAPDEEILLYLDQALSSVPHAEGVNNHMGSAATGDRRVMKVILSHLKQKGLFFVDSRVTPETVVPEIAKESGLSFTTRDVFIDNQMNPSAIRKKLEEAKQIALTHGKAVVIGHDRKMTLQVIKEAVAAFEKDGIRFVLVKELLDSS